MHFLDFDQTGKKKYSHIYGLVFTRTERYCTIPSIKSWFAIERTMQE
jgi:hypothetical protein